MKAKLIKILVLCLIASVMLFAVSCVVTVPTTPTSESVGEHVCDFSTLKTDEFNHWYECWCGNVDGEKIAHNYSNKWSYNNAKHYHKCFCGVKKDNQEHEWVEEDVNSSDKECAICGFVLTEYKGTEFATFTLSGFNAYGKVSNTTTKFVFENEIIINGEASYVVSSDKYGLKTYVSKVVPLSVGDNVFYVFVSVNEEIVETYVVTIRRKPIYTVSFNVNGGETVASQQIEEDSFASEPTTQRAGYDFVSWDYDFTSPITNSITINASWSAHTNTKYTVEYYLQNLEDDNYTLDHTDELEGTTDTTANAEIKTIEHFTYNASKSVISGNIDGDGSRVLKVYYTRDKYIVSTARNNIKAGTDTGSGTYKFNKQITVKATTNAGYTFNGWYDEETLITEESSYAFTVEKNVTYTAKWTANADTKYIVEYYLQNVEDDNYTLDHTDELEGTTDTTATAEIKSFEHFTYNANKSTARGNINGDGSLVLKVYYTLDKYAISVNIDGGRVTNAGNHKYGYSLSSTVTVYLGYDFIGWYSGEELLSTDLTYEFTVEKSVVAKFEVWEELSNFNFTSTTTDCTITGIKDKTVTEIVVPDYVTSISGGAFSGCTNLQSITLPFVGGSKNATTASSSTLLGYIFGKSSYTGSTKVSQCYASSSHANYYIPASLTQVTITGGNILYGAFYKLDSLTSVEMGGSITRIGSEAFYDCGSLTSVVIPDSVINIGDYAFQNCTSLSSVVIGDNVISIGVWAFFNCTSLTSVVMGDRVTSIDAEVFGNCANLQYYEYGNCKYLGTINNPYYALIKVIDKDGTSCTIHNDTVIIASHAFMGCSYIEEMTVPNGVTNIGDYAFSWCSSLTSITIPDSVISIGERAFQYSTSLTSVKIPDSVTNMGDGIFSNCSGLINVVIGDGVTSVGERAFYDCVSLTSVVIGRSVTSVDEYAFYLCTGLTSVVMPNSVTSIGKDAFNWCTSLKSIKYRGTEAEWLAISKYKNWDVYFESGSYKKINYTIIYNYQDE